MSNHAVLRQHLLRHSTHTIHSKLCMIVHNAITSSSEHLWFHPSYCNFCLCCIHVQDVDRRLSFESLASWSPSIGYAFLCISVRLSITASRFLAFLFPSPGALGAFLSFLTVSNNLIKRVRAQVHIAVPLLSVFFASFFLRHFPDLRNEKRKRKSNSGSPFFRRLAEIRVGGVQQVL